MFKANHQLLIFGFESESGKKIPLAFDSKKDRRLHNLILRNINEMDFRELYPGKASSTKVLLMSWWKAWYSIRAIKPPWVFRALAKDSSQGLAFSIFKTIDLTSKRTKTRWEEKLWIMKKHLKRKNTRLVPTKSLKRLIFGARKNAKKFTKFYHECTCK